MLRRPAGLFQWKEEVHLWPVVPQASHTPAWVSKSPEGRVSEVDAGMVSAGRGDGDVLVQILEVEGGRQKTNPFGGFLAVASTDNSPAEVFSICFGLLLVLVWRVAEILHTPLKNTTVF